jgi:hypothetical protein
MISIPKIVGGMSSGFVLCLGLTDTTQATEHIKSNECSEMKAGQRDRVKCEEDRKQGIATVKGEVVHIEQSKYVVQRFYGKEIQLDADASTEVTKPIDLGDSIEAKVLDEPDRKHVLSIRQLGK